MKHITDALDVIHEAIGKGDEKAKAIILDDLLGMLTSFIADTPMVTLRALHGKAQGEESQATEAAIVQYFIEKLPKNPLIYFYIVQRILRPRWINGGEPLFANQAPPFEEVKEPLLATLDCGLIDVEGFAATLIGRYGPEAKSVLPELVERLRKYRTDCSKAPGLTWAVYQIGGLSSTVKSILLEVAEGEDSCPHARPLAQEILKMNEVPFTWNGKK